jgi:DUF917 family protein
MTLLKKIDKQSLEVLMVGSQFLGSGGGGKIHILRQLVKDSFDDSFSVDLIDLNEIDEVGIGTTVGMVGSPEALEEFLPTGQEGRELLEKMQELTGKKTDAIFTIEGAGVNLIYPVIVAYATGLPLMDGDAMGRAFPELPMTTFQFNNQPIAPIVFQDIDHISYVYNDQDASMVDLKIRQKIAETTGMAFFSGYQAPFAVLKRILIPHTFSVGIKIGEAFLNAKSFEDLMRELGHVTRNSLYGSAIEITRGVVSEHVAMDHSNIASYQVGEYTVYYHYENLMVYHNKKLVANVPDLITLVDLDTLEPISVTDAELGMRVAIVATPAPLHLRTPTALSYVGPKAFGFKSAYEPLEKIHFKHYF